MEIICDGGINCGEQSQSPFWNSVPKCPEAPLSCVWEILCSKCPGFQIPPLCQTSKTFNLELDLNVFSVDGKKHVSYSLKDQLVVVIHVETQVSQRDELAFQRDPRPKRGSR